MELIVLDTNILLYAAKYKIDLATELSRICDFKYKVALPQQVIQELKALSEAGKGKDKEAASLALQISKEFEIQKIPGKTADDALLKLAANNILATMDRELRKRFKNDKKGRVISIRQKNHLIFV